MICNKCGQPVADGLAFCPMCGNPVPVENPSSTGSYIPYQQPGSGTGRYPTYSQKETINIGNSYQSSTAQDGYGVFQQPGMQASYPPYQQNTGAQMQPPESYQPLGVSQAYNDSQDPSSPLPVRFLASLRLLPGRLLKSVTAPGEALKELVEARDFMTAGFVAAFTLLMTFIAGMLMLRPAVSMILSASGIPGNQLNGYTSQAMEELSRYIVPAGFGGVAVLVQGIIMVISVAIYLFYGCVMKKVPFSWEMALGFAAIMNVPAAVVSVLTIVSSLFCGPLALLLILCGFVLGLSQANQLMITLTGVTFDRDYLSRTLLNCVVVIVCAMITWLAGGSGIAKIFSTLIL